MVHHKNREPSISRDSSSEDEGATGADTAASRRAFTLSQAWQYYSSHQSLDDTREERWAAGDDPDARG